MIIQITNPKTQLEANLEKIDKPIRRIENRTKANIQDLNESFDAFWKLPDEEINEILTHKGIGEVTKIFTAHNEYGVSFNKLLEDRGIAGVRAVVVAPRELFVNDEGNFQVVPIPEPVDGGDDFEDDLEE
jgi:tRNA(Ile2) C34 agmatinyltransferase TiaS